MIETLDSIVEILTTPIPILPGDDGWLEKTIYIGVIAWIGLHVKSFVTWMYHQLYERIVNYVYLDDSTRMYTAFADWYNKNYPESIRNREAKIVPSYSNGSANHFVLFRQFSDSRIIKYKGVRVMVSKGRDRLDSANDPTNAYINTYRLYSLFSPTILEEMIMEAYDEWMMEKMEDTGLRAIVTDKWRNSKIRHIHNYKTIDQVYVDGKEDLLQDIKNFLAQKALYKRLGVRFKRSYLLHGPPGTGKTTLVFAIAHWTKRPVYYLNPKGFDSDTSFETFVGEVERDSIILIEDVDVFWTNRDAGSNTSVSFQSLLNTLDGLHSPENVIIFMTTNNPNNFDEAFMRKGRMDYKMRVGFPSKGLIEKFIADVFGTMVYIPELRESTPMVNVQDACIKSSTAAEAVQRLLEEDG